jgi:hypothetical protein
LAAHAAASTCPGPAPPTGDGQSTPTIRVIVPLALSSAVTSVKVTWRMSVSGSESLAWSGGCPSPVLDSQGNGSDDCSAMAQWLVGIDAVLIDKSTGVAIRARPTTGSGVYNESYESRFTTCYHFNCTSSNSSRGGAGGSLTRNWTVSFYLNGTFVAGHPYRLWLTVTGGVYAWYTNSCSALGVAGSFPSVQARAQVNMARSGFVANLTSIQIS